jgi:hypothetical protein
VYHTHWFISETLEGSNHGFAFFCTPLIPFLTFLC